MKMFKTNNVEIVM